LTISVDNIEIVKKIIKKKVTKTYIFNAICSNYN